MAEKLKWGIISTAWINDVVIPAINNSKRSDLVGVASRDPDRARAYASKKNIPKAYGSYEDLLNDREIDVVYISVPNTLHSEWIIKALEAGKHVLCEKPIVTTMKELESVEAALKKHRVVLFEAFMYLHHPQTLKIKELIQSGRLGDVLSISSCFDYYLPEDAADNIRLNKKLDGGSLWDVGVYPNSLAISMADAGAPSEVYAIKRYDGTEVDSSAYGQLKFSNNVVAHIAVSLRSPNRVGATIVGMEGFLSINNPWKPGLDGNESQIVLTTTDDREEVFRFPAVTPYQSEIAAMESCIIDGSEPIVPMNMSRQFLRSMLALHESARTGTLITL